jgi:hypothetical protein
MKKERLSSKHILPKSRHRQPLNRGHLSALDSALHFFVLVNRHFITNEAVAESFTFDVVVVGAATQEILCPAREGTIALFQNGTMMNL